MTDTRTRAGRAMRAFGVALLASATAACGSQSDFANEPRPPAPINVTAVIGDRGIDVSPDRFGAGPIVLIIANQSSEEREVTIQTIGSGPGIRQKTSPINARGTAELKVDLTKGAYRLSVDSEKIDDARLRVGPPRASAQNELLQP